jgi:hypothetical protein
MHAGTDPAVSPGADTAAAAEPDEGDERDEPDEPADRPGPAEPLQPVAPTEPVARSERPPTAAVVLSFAVSDRKIVAMLATFATALFAFAARLRLNEQPWGDEPHYLIMSIALGKYHSFDLGRAYAGNDYHSFYPQQIDAHVFAGPDGTMIPLHNFGAPLLWALPYALWGRAGVAALMVAVSVLIVVNVYRLQRELGIVRPYAALVTGLFVIGTPIYMYASMQFVEPLGALIVVFAVRAVLSPAPSAVRVAVASAGLGYLPWVHGRFIVFAVILGGLLVARVGRARWTAYLPAVVPLVVLVVALELFNAIRYGSWSPAPGNANYGDGLFQIAPQTGLSGLLFDRQYGLLSHFPLLVLAVPGLLLALRRGALRRHVVLIAVIAPYLLAVTTFRYWWAGWSPPGRLLVVVVPLLAYYVAVTLQRLHAWTLTTLAAFAALAGFTISVTGDFHTMFRFTTSGGDGVDPVLSLLAERLHLTALPEVLPTAFAPGTDRIDFGAWFLLLAMFSIALWMLGQARPVEWIPAEPLTDLFPTLRRSGTSDKPSDGSSDASSDQSPAADAARPDGGDRPGRRTPTSPTEP